MDDERLSKIEKQRQDALTQSNNVYNQVLQNNQDLYNMQNESLNNYEQISNDMLDKQLAYNTELINQQKEKALENKEAEDIKALNDYTAYNNRYGKNAEALASSGLLSSGVSAMERVGSFNTYQNRLASANKVYNNAVLEYDNAIKEARNNNDLQKAQNALNKLQMQIEYATSYYGNKNNYSLSQLSANQNLDSDYFNRYQTEYGNILNEKAQNEAIRQWEEEMKFKKDQAAQDQKNWEKEYALSKSKVYSSGGSGGTGITDTSSNELNTTTNANVIVNPYTGDINKDAYNGTFSNNYQPDNVGGAKLSKSGIKVKDIYGNTATGVSGINLGDQNIWTANNKYYIWDGSMNDYIDVTKEVTNALKKNASIIWNK